jgi:hypothetical protein
MAKYIYTITKGSPDEIWMTMSDATFLKNNFTKKEINEVLIPHRDLICSLPGYQSQLVNPISDVVREYILIFDTLDNANNAYQVMVRPYANNSIQDIQQNLMLSKRQELNVNYTITFRVEP